MVMREKELLLRLFLNTAKILLRRGPCECMVEAVSPLFPYEYSLHNKPLILKLYYLEFLVFSILKSLKNMN